MQKVCSAMVAHSIFSSQGNYIGLYAVTHAHETFADTSIMNNQTFQRTTGILNLKDPHRATQITTVTYLTTAFSIERSDIKYHKSILWSTYCINLDTINNQSNDLTRTCDTLMTCEFSWSNMPEHLRKRPIVSHLYKCACCSA